MSDNNNSDLSIFDKMKQIELILAGSSHGETRKILSAVSALHELRVISVYQPIGQSTAGTVRTVPFVQVRKGKPPPPAAWKQTDSYKSLMKAHADVVKDIKRGGSDVASKEQLIVKLRELELSLKNLKVSRSGN